MNFQSGLARSIEGSEFIEETRRGVSVFWINVDSSCPRLCDLFSPVDWWGVMDLDGWISFEVTNLGLDF